MRGCKTAGSGLLSNLSTPSKPRHPRLKPEVGEGGGRQQKFLSPIFPNTASFYFLPSPSPLPSHSPTPYSTCPYLFLACLVSESPASNDGCCRTVKARVNRVRHGQNDEDKRRGGGVSIVETSAPLPLPLPLPPLGSSSNP